MKPILTERLVLRDWVPGDLDALLALHADPQVSYWLAGSLSRDAAAASIESMMRFNAEHGWGVRAVCLTAAGPPIGAAGLQIVKPFMPFTGVEATWRLASRWWGSGFVTEAMRILLLDGFERLPVDEIVTFTSSSNTRSQAVMRRLGFVADPAGDFDHPRLAPGHPLRRHVFYRFDRGSLQTAVTG